MSDADESAEEDESSLGDVHKGIKRSQNLKKCKIYSDKSTKLDQRERWFKEW